MESTGKSSLFRCLEWKRTESVEKGSTLQLCYKPSPPIDTPPSPVINCLRKPKKALPAVLPGIDTGPASHGMCSGANDGLDFPRLAKKRGKGLGAGLKVQKMMQN